MPIFHGGLHVDFGQDAEAFDLECFGHLGHGLSEVLLWQRAVKTIAGHSRGAGRGRCVDHDVALHLAAGAGGMRSDIMSIIICIMAMWSVII